MAQEMLEKVNVAFTALAKEYPTLQKHLDKCYQEIQTTEHGKMNLQKIDRKEKIKKVLKSMVNTTHLYISYDGLVAEVATNEDELITLLKKLSTAILDCKKKILMFASRQGKLLKDAKTGLEPCMFKLVITSCDFSTSYSNFLISLYHLFEENPKLCYCTVPIRLFRNNMRIIREICGDEPDFWKNI